MIAILVICSILILWAWACFLFDEVVKYHHDHYYDNWLSEGRTRGMFWVPKDARKALTAFPIGVYAWKLRKGRLGWIETDVRAKHLVQRYLFWEKVWLVYIVVALSVTMFVTIAT